jgi:hypothetical protein
MPRDTRYESGFTSHTVRLREEWPKVAARRERFKALRAKLHTDLTRRWTWVR